MAPAPTAEAYVLYEQYEKAALAALWKYFPKLAGDEDFQQLARIGLWNACLRFDPERGAFLTIAYRAIWSEIQHHFRIQGAKSRVPKEVLVELDAPMGHRSQTRHENDYCTLHDVLPDRKNGQWVDFEGFWNQLNDVQRQIVGMRMEGYTMNEIGLVLGVTLQRVQQRLTEARRVFERYV